jgi:hypothetical protein
LPELVDPPETRRGQLAHLHVGSSFLDISIECRSTSSVGEELYLFDVCEARSRDLWPRRRRLVDPRCRTGTPPPSFSTRSRQLAHHLHVHFTGDEGLRPRGPARQMGRARSTGRLSGFVLSSKKTPSDGPYSPSQKRGQLVQRVLQGDPDEPPNIPP